MAMKIKVLLAASAIMLTSCGSPGPPSYNPPTRGEVMRETVERYERCLERGVWSARQCREQYERQMEPLLP